MVGRALSGEEVRAIRLDPRYSTEVAPEYGVSPSLVRQARLGIGSYADEPFPEGMPYWKVGGRGGSRTPGLRGDASPVAKLSTGAVVYARKLRGTGATFRDLRDEVVEVFDLPEVPTVEAVRKAVRGLSWSHLPGAVR